MTSPYGLEGELVIFAGPSRPAGMRADVAGVEWRGPAVAGDMLRLMAEGPPRCVAIIDGQFDQAPAVRHKEILLLLARGVHVLGAASMGALRAAELSPFGMVGVGQVYRAYADLRLERDDEVALLHGPAELDWAPFTVPLVNVRATLLHAVRRRRVSPEQARRMVALAGDVFYQDRTWDELIRRTWDVPDLAAALDNLTKWLPDGQVEVKRADAAECIQAGLSLRWAPPTATPEPPDTLFSQAFKRSMPGAGVSEQDLTDTIHELLV